MLNSAFQLNVGLIRREESFRYWPVACDVRQQDENNTTPSQVGPELLAPQHPRAAKQWDTEALHSANSGAPRSDGAAALQARTRHREVTDEGDCGDGSGCGKGRDEVDGAARAAGGGARQPLGRELR